MTERLPVTDDKPKQPKLVPPPHAKVMGQTTDGRPVITFTSGPFKGRTYAMKHGGGLQKVYRQRTRFMDAK